ncbi:hypothetical protein AN958_00391 [Leucoagaricus sp. SymC.cos]|nr:hypothetical protein AN958_00391 [Leucoagaricus sp. SymC.cos]
MDVNNGNALLWQYRVSGLAMTTLEPQVWRPLTLATLTLATTTLWSGGNNPRWEGLLRTGMGSGDGGTG